MKRVEIAFLGFGHFLHSPMWIEALSVMRGVRVRHGWDHDPARLRDFSTRYGFPANSDLNEVLADQAVDAVVICAENNWHAPLIEAAALAGKSVYCEKPTVISKQEAKRVQAVVQASCICYMQSFPKRFDRAHQDIAKFIASGRLGHIHLTRVRHGHGGALSGNNAMATYRESWFTDLKASGGGSFLDEGVHGADLIRWLMGHPVAVTAVMGSRSREGREASGTAIYEFANDSQAILQSGSIYASGTSCLEVYGEKGTLIVEGTDMASNRLVGFSARWTSAARPEWKELKTRSDFGTRTYHQNGIRTFVRCIRRQTPPPCSLEDGLGAFQMIDAAYQAARSGKRVLISEI